MFSALKAIVGEFAKLKVDIKDLWGGFSMKQEVNVAINARGVTQKRRYFAEDGRTALGDVSVEMVEQVNDTRGLNSSIINESGDVDPDLFVTKAKLLGAATRNAQLEMAAAGQEFVMVDSQLSLLVSMLSSLFVQTYKEAGAPVTIRDYDDGHVKMGLLNMISTPPSPNVSMFTGFSDHEVWEQTSIDAAPDCSVLLVNYFKEVDIKFILASLNGRNKTTRLAFDLAIPQLAERVLLSGVKNTYEFDNYVVPSARQIRLTLDKYVIANRLEGTFSAAMAIMHQIAFTPLPDTAEGYAWMMRDRVVTLPAFSAWRGTYRFLLSETPFGLDTYVSEAWKWWRDCGLSTCVAASNLTAISLWGRYLAEGHFYHDDANVHRLGVHDFRDSPGAAYYSYAALVTGQDVTCPLPRTVGLTYSPWDEDTVFDLPVTLVDSESDGYTLETVSGVTKLKVGRLPAPCSAIHVLGKMPENSAFSALSSRLSVTATRLQDGWVLPSVDKAWVFSMISRWCGYDAEMEYKGVVRRANWAPNLTSIATRPFHVIGPDRVQVIVNSVGAREKVFMSLPPLEDDVNTWTADVGVSPSIIFMRHDKRPVRTTGTFYPPAAGSGSLIVPAVHEMMFMPISIRATHRIDLREAGFQILGRETAHEPQQPVATVTQLQPDDGLEPAEHEV